MEKIRCLKKGNVIMFTLIISFVLSSLLVSILIYSSIVNKEISNLQKEYALDEFISSTVYEYMITGNKNDYTIFQDGDYILMKYHEDTYVFEGYLSGKYLCLRRVNDYEYE